MKDFELSPEEFQLFREELERRAKEEDDRRRVILEAASVPETNATVPPTASAQRPSVPTPSDGAKAAEVVCPHCGSPDHRKVSGSVSRAPGRIPYRVCSLCEQPYLPPIRFRIAKAVGCAILAILLCVGGGLAVSASAPTAIIILIIILLFFAAALSLGGLCICLLASDKVEPVTVVPDDGGKLSDRLREWITTSRGSRFGRAFRFVVRGFGTLMAGIGSLFCFGVSGMIFMALQNKQMPVGLGSFFIFTFVLGIVGLALHLIGKGISQRRAVDVLDPDGARPILLLRSFRDDGAPLPMGNTFEQNTNPSKSSNTLEETLTKTFAEVGPVVAVGRPGELMQPSGASRAYLSDEEWKEWVADLLEWSQQVVMLLGSPKVHLSQDDGLTWEVLRVYRNVAPQKIILLIPPHLSEDEVRRRWRSYTTLLGGKFPNHHPDAVLIRYDSNWTASVVSAKNFRNRDSEDCFEALKKAVAYARDWTDPAYGFDVTKIDCN